MANRDTPLRATLGVGMWRPARHKRVPVLLAAVSLLGVGAAASGRLSAQSKVPELVINVAGVIHVEPAAETAFPIPVGPTEALPRNAFLRIRGLPKTVTLSEGHQIAGGSWAVPLSVLSTLKISSPLGSEGKTDITISLVTLDGQVLTETKAALLIAPAALLSAGQPLRPVSRPSIAAQGLSASAGAQPVPAGGPQLKPDDRERAQRYVQKGDESMANGNVTVARLFYRRAAEMGLAQGALALAMTYDPNELARWKVIGGIQADREQARLWYEKAQELGAADAVARLQRLSAR